MFLDEIIVWYSGCSILFWVSLSKLDNLLGVFERVSNRFSLSKVKTGTVWLMYTDRSVPCPVIICRFVVYKYVNHFSKNSVLQCPI